MFLTLNHICPNITLIKSSAQLAPFSPWGSCNYYKGTSLIGSFCLISQLTVATKHCLATYWFLFTIAILCLVQNLTLTCRVDETAPIAWIHGLPRITIYGENEVTTIKVTITSLPSIFTGSEICPSEITIRPSNPTKGVSYLERSSILHPSPLNKSGYITSAPLPWSINTLFAIKPFIWAVTTKALSCG